MRDFKKLSVWEKSHQLTLAIYRLTKSFPREELYGLSSQVRRATSSIPANIAEGCGRQTDKEFARFLSIAFGSTSEVQYHLILAKDLGYLSEREFIRLERQTVEVKRMLSGLISKVRPKS